MTDPKQSKNNAQAKDSQGQTCTFEGRTFKHGEERCDSKTNRVARCDNGSWIITEEPCVPGQRGDAKV